MADIHLVFYHIRIICILLLHVSVFGVKQYENGLSAPAESQENVLQSQSHECTTFKYSSNGLLYGCGYSIDIIRLTTLHKSHAFLSSYLSQTRLTLLNQRASLSMGYDIRTAGNISFAFESGSKRLFTAWGPNLQLRYLHSSDSYEIFENVYPNRPLYNQKCVPFCTILHTDDKNVQIEQDLRSAPVNLNKYTEFHQSFHNTLAFQVSDYSSPFIGNRISSVRQLAFEGCEACDFGSSAQSCPDIMSTCLRNEFSCNSAPTFYPDNSSIVCKGIYHVFLNPKTAFCPLDATTLDMYMYGMCECIYFELKDQIDSDQLEIKVYKSSTSKIGRQIQTTERNSDSRIFVLLLGKKKDRYIIKRAIEAALNKNSIGQKDIKNINWKATKASIDCGKSNIKMYTEQCSVQIIVNTISR